MNSIKFQVASAVTMTPPWAMYGSRCISTARHRAMLPSICSLPRASTAPPKPTVGKDASGTYYCYFPMPYDQSAKIVLVNQNGYAVNLSYQCNTIPHRISA